MLKEQVKLDMTFASFFEIYGQDKKKRFGGGKPKQLREILVL